jgi:hypothetical protein
MDRRTFNKLTGLAAIGALSQNMDLPAEQLAPPQNSAQHTEKLSAFPNEVVLEDSELFVAFDSGSGALTRLQRKSTHWSIQRRPELGVSFRMLAPLPHRRQNFILGQKQRAFHVEKISDHQVRLEWKDLISEHGGVLPMTFVATVTLQNGALTFDSTLINDSQLSVETVDYPYLGELNSPTRDSKLSSEHMNYGDLESKEIYPDFWDGKGYWGDDFPTKTIESKESLFCLIQSPTEGIYVEMHDATQPYLLEYTFEQHPGALQSVDYQVPRQDDISGIPVHLEFRTCHFVFAHPHSTRKLAPVVLRCYSGDWHAGVDLYKQWRSTWFKKPPVAAWVTDVN